jgi:hypothetical protein
LDEAAEWLRQDSAELVLALEPYGEEDEVGLHLGAVVEDDAVLGETPAAGPLEPDQVLVGHVEEAVGEDGHLAAGVVLHEGVVRPEPVLVQRQVPRQVRLDELWTRLPSAHARTSNRNNPPKSETTDTAANGCARWCAQFPKYLSF